MSKLARMAQLPSSGSLHSLWISSRSLCARHLLLLQLVLLRTPCCEEPRGQNHCRYQIEDRDARPHQCSGALLVCESGDAKLPWCGDVNRINDTVTKHKESGKNVAGDRCEKKVEE